MILFCLYPNVCNIGDLITFFLIADSVGGCFSDSSWRFVKIYQRSSPIVLIELGLFSQYKFITYICNLAVVSLRIDESGEPNCEKASNTSSEELLKFLHVVNLDFPLNLKVKSLPLKAW